MRDALIPFADDQNDQKFLIAFENWLASHGGSTSATVRAYLAGWNRAAEQARALGVPLSRLRATDARRIYDRLIPEPGRTNTANLTLSACRQAWDHLVAAGLARENPWASIKHRHARDDVGERVLTEDEIRRIYQAAEWPRYRAVIGTLYYGGCRVAEAVGLQWRHMQATGAGGWRMEVFGKGEKTRYVPMHARWAADLLRLPPPHRSDAPILRPSRGDGQGLTVRGVQMMVTRFARVAGIDRPVSPHWFRHSYASHLADHGASLKDIQQLLGHADIRTTARYVHLLRPPAVDVYLPDLLDVGDAIP